MGLTLSRVWSLPLNYWTIHALPLLVDSGAELDLERSRLELGNAALHGDGE